MKSLRGYPATYSPVSYEDVDIAHLNYEEENAPKNYLEQIRYLLEEGNAVTTLPLNTIGGYVGGAVMGKLGEFGSKYGGQVLDWSQNKFRSSLNNRMQGILTDTSGHSLNIPEIAARRQQIYDNFVFQNADKEVLDFTPTRRQLESYIAQSKFNPNKNYTKEKAKQVLRERVSETNLNVFNDNLSNLGNSELGINHFLKEDKDPYVRTAARTYLYPDLKFTKDGTDYYVRKYFNNKSNKAFQDMFLVREGKAFNKLPSSNNHIANKLKGAQDLSLAPALRAMTTTGASPSDINITLQPVLSIKNYRMYLIYITN
ncbi:MAG: hypothetical protein J6N49_03135 [Alphaproteobacteria bacterium]|nr:hypothetical protein [Alphaproteobacteria bacterium]